MHRRMRLLPRTDLDVERTNLRRLHKVVELLVVDIILLLKVVNQLILSCDRIMVELLLPIIFTLVDLCKQRKRD